MSVMLAGALMFLLLLSGVLAGSSLLSAAERKRHSLGRDLQGTLLLDRRRRASGSLLRPSTLVPEVLADFSRLVMAMISHGSLVVGRAVEPSTGILT
jgi:hypothetical protein